MYMIVATVTWLFLTPELARMKEFSAGWIARDLHPQSGHADRPGDRIARSPVVE